MRRLYAHVLVSAVAGVLAGVGTAHAQEAERKWFPPATLGEEFSYYPYLAMDHDGAALVLFKNTMSDQVSRTTRAPGADFTPSAVVPWLRGSNISTAYDSDGRFVLSWIDSDSNDLRYLVYDPSTGAQRFGTLVEGAKHPMSNTVRADGNGTVYIAWQETDPSNGACCLGPYVAKMKDGEEFGSFQRLNDIGSPGLALDVSRTGAAVVAWGDFSGHWAAVQPAGGTFGSPEEVKGASVINGSTPTVSIDDAGEALFVLRSEEPTGDSLQYRLIFTVRRPDGTYSEPQELSTTDDAGFAEIAAGPRGEAVVAWSEGDFEDATLFTSVRASDGSFSQPTVVATGTQAIALVGMDDAGNAIAAWLAHLGDTYQVYAAHRPPLGNFGIPQPISGPGLRQGAFPRLAVGGPGNAIVAWQGATNRVEAAVFDVAPPLVPEFEVSTPAATVGRRAARRRLSFRWQVSEQSRVTIDLRRRGQVVRRVRREAAPGENALVVRRRRLRKGRYKAILHATDRLGHQSEPRADRFRLRRRLKERH